MSACCGTGEKSEGSVDEVRLPYDIVGENVIYRLCACANKNLFESMGFDSKCNSQKARQAQGLYASAPDVLVCYLSILYPTRKTVLI